MSYTLSTLLPEEKIIYKTGPHWIVFAPTIANLLIALISLVYGNRVLPNLFPILGMSLPTFVTSVLFLFAVYQAGSAWILFSFSEYGITNQRILVKTGLIQRQTLELVLKRVESLRVNQTILGRIFNYGTIVITGTGGSHDFVSNVPTPLTFRELAQGQIAVQQKE